MNFSTAQRPMAPSIVGFSAPNILPSLTLPRQNVKLKRRATLISLQALRNRCSRFGHSGPCANVDRGGAFLALLTFDEEWAPLRRHGNDAIACCTCKCSQSPRGGKQYCLRVDSLI